jgi:hypothetical protein
VRNHRTPPLGSRGQRLCLARALPALRLVGLTGSLLDPAPARSPRRTMIGAVELPFGARGSTPGNYRFSRRAPVSASFGHRDHEVCLDAFGCAHGRECLHAFRGYGLVPPGLPTLSVDTLRWDPPPTSADVAALAPFVRMLTDQQSIPASPNFRSSPTTSSSRRTRTRRRWYRPKKLS